MEGSADYLTQLESAIDKRREWIEATQIPKLREAFVSFTALFESVTGMLIRKGFLREDPYNYDQSFTEIVLPSDETLPEFENTDELSFRIAAYRRQLKFVSTEYPLELESLSLARLKKLSSLLTYISWLEFGEASKSPTTRAFARGFMKIRIGSDSMASQILKDSEIQIVKLTHQIRGQLADMIGFHRESWKADIRREVLPAVAAPAGGAPGDPRARREELLKAIRRVFANRMAGKPWYPTLTEEIADEELAADGEARKERILVSLAVATEATKMQAAQQVDGRTILLEAVRLMARPHEELATAVVVLEENESLLAGSQGGNGWLKRLFAGGTGSSAKERIYKLQWSEPGVAAPRTEVLDFAQFAEDVKKKASLLAALSSSTSAAFKKLAGTGEEQLASFIDKQLSELLLIHRRLGCLNTLFQARVMQEKKAARGIKIELLTIKNSIVKANQRRHDYGDGSAG
jgi:hypothetical protein